MSNLHHRSWHNTIPDDSIEVQTLYKYLIENGLRNEINLQLRCTTGDACRGLYIGGGGKHHPNGIQPNETVLYIPKKLLITVDVFRQHYPNVSFNFCDEISYLVAYLVYAKQHLTMKHWSPLQEYLPTLPSSFDWLPCFWPSDDGDDNGFPRQWIEMVRKERNCFDVLCCSIKKQMNIHHHHDDHNESIDEKIKWAYGVVITRCVHLNTSSSNNSTIALVPFFDMFNHSPDAPVTMDRFTTTTTATINDDGGIRMYAYKPIEPYSEVCIEYHKFNNRKLLLHYGFCDISPPIVSPSPLLSMTVYPSKQDSIEISFKWIYNVLVEYFTSSSSHKTCFKFGRKSVIDVKERIAALKKVEGFISDTELYGLTWPIEAFEPDEAKIVFKSNECDQQQHHNTSNGLMFDVSIEIITSNNHSSQFFMPDLEQNESTTLDWRLAKLLRFICRSTWGNVQYIKSLIYNTHVANTQMFTSDCEHKLYCKLWIYLLEKFMIDEHKLVFNNDDDNCMNTTTRSTLNIYQSIHKRLMFMATMIDGGHNRPILREMITNELAMLLSLWHMFSIRLQQLEHNSVFNQ